MNHNPLVIALDVDTADQALSLVKQLRGKAGLFKVGKQLFTAEGPDIVRRIIDMGESVFLDLKYHDIPNTVAKAGIEAMRLGIKIFNVHALGGSTMMRTVSTEVRAAAERENKPCPMILGVTVLTSSNQKTLNELGIYCSVEQQVERLAVLANSSGLDGVVASPLEIAIIRKSVSNQDFVVLTPGVRPKGSSADDQSRIMTPAEAIKAGATYIVIGRPITAAENPSSAADKILQEIEKDAS